MSGQTYKGAGVDLDAASKVKELLKPHVMSTFNAQVVSESGLFAGALRLDGYKRPVLVSTTDGVGTKILISLAMDRLDNLGYDVVNQSVNDVLTSGARPLFFLDYLAVGRLITSEVEIIVKGIANACKEIGCVLLGGETSQMPSIYKQGSIDLVGFLTGVVEEDRLLTPSRVEAGDVLLGLSSNGLHTNGYSLVRAVFKLADGTTPLHEYYSELACTLGDALLVPHRSYWPLLDGLITSLKAMAHITGGGIEENVSRVIPDGLVGEIDWDSWLIPPLFQIIQSKGEIDQKEMRRVFNLGVGMVLVCSQYMATQICESLPEAWVIGRVMKG